MLQRSTSVPALPVEKRVAEHLVRRMMTESEGCIMKVPTRGQVTVQVVAMTWIKHS